MVDDPAPELIPFANDDACAGAIGDVARIDAELQRIEADKNDAVQAAAKTAEDLAGPLSARRLLLTRSVEAYCTENRERLTDGGKRKSAPFATGEGQWRKTRDSVIVDPEQSTAIVEKLKGMGRSFARFIRSKEEPGRTLLAAATDAEKARLRKIKGIRFQPGVEVFEVKPAALPLAERPSGHPFPRSPPSRAESRRCASLTTSRARRAGDSCRSSPGCLSFATG